MKQLKLTFFALISTTMAFATNGSHLIGVSPLSVSMGGTGVAQYQGGMDALHKNPALLGQYTTTAEAESSDRWYFEVSEVFFKFNVSANAGLGEKFSASGVKGLPTIGAHGRFNDWIGLGVGIMTYGGDVVDFTGAGNIVDLKQVKADYQYTKLVPGISFLLSEDFSVGVGPQMTYGTLAINEDALGLGQSNRPSHGAVGFGGTVGATWEPVADLVFGFAYTSETTLEFEQILDLDLFGPSPLTGGLDNVTVQLPDEWSLGVAWSWEDWRFTFDWRFIQWASADLYRALDWDNQHVIAFGMRYFFDKIDIRGGYNYAASPIKSATGEIPTNTVSINGHPINQSSISLLNTSGLPALAQSHFTVGFGWQLSDGFRLDSSFMYSPASTVTRVAAASAYTLTGTTKQWSAGIGATIEL